MVAMAAGMNMKNKQKETFDKTSYLLGFNDENLEAHKVGWEQLKEKIENLFQCPTSWIRNEKNHPTAKEDILFLSEEENLSAEL